MSITFVIDEAFTSQFIYKIGFDWLKCFCYFFLIKKGI